MIIIFWQNCTSIHQYPLLTELTKAAVEVIQIVEQFVPDDRAAMGWTVPDGGYKVLLFDEVDLVKFIEAHQDAYHVFSGFNAFKKVTRAFRYLYSRSPKHCIVFQERPDQRGFKGILREVVYQFYCIRFRKINAILAAGSITFFKKKFCVSRIIPFPYYVYPPRKQLQPYSQPKEFVRFIFIGALISRKNILGMCQAFAKARSTWALTIVGDGDQIQHIQELKMARPECKVTHLGYLQNMEIGTHLYNSDCLILPSLMDGYGAVVNEAALSGLRIICSTSAGGSEHLQRLDVENWYFSPRSIIGLTNLIDRVANLGRVKTTERLMRINAAKELLPAEGAKLLIKTLCS